MLLLEFPCALHVISQRNKLAWISRGGSASTCHHLTGQKVSQISKSSVGTRRTSYVHQQMRSPHLAGPQSRVSYPCRKISGYDRVQSGYGRCIPGYEVGNRVGNIISLERADWSLNAAPRGLTGRPARRRRQHVALPTMPDPRRAVSFHVPLVSWM